MNEEQDPRDIPAEDKWDYIFKMRRKNKEIDRYYTLHLILLTIIVQNY